MRLGLGAPIDLRALPHVHITQRHYLKQTRFKEYTRIKRNGLCTTEPERKAYSRRF
jgi:hypothetical protein